MDVLSENQAKYKATLFVVIVVVKMPNSSMMNIPSSAAVAAAAEATNPLELLLNAAKFIEEEAKKLGASLKEPISKLILYPVVDVDVDDAIARFVAIASR